MGSQTEFSTAPTAAGLLSLGTKDGASGLYDAVPNSTWARPEEASRIGRSNDRHREPKFSGCYCRMSLAATGGDQQTVGWRCGWRDVLWKESIRDGSAGSTKVCWIFEPPRAWGGDRRPAVVVSREGRGCEAV